MKSDLDELPGNFQQSGNEYNSESRELDVGLTSNGLHEDVNPNGYEFRSLSNLNSRRNGEIDRNGPVVQLATQNRYSNTEEFSSNIKSISTKRTLENFIYFNCERNTPCI